MDELFVIKRIAVYMYIKVRLYTNNNNNNTNMYMYRLWDSYLSEITEGFENFHVYVCAGKFICMCIV